MPTEIMEILARILSRLPEMSDDAVEADNYDELALLQETARVARKATESGLNAGEISALFRLATALGHKSGDFALLRRLLRGYVPGMRLGDRMRDKGALGENLLRLHLFMEGSEGNALGRVNVGGDGNVSVGNHLSLSDGTLYLFMKKMKSDARDSDEGELWEAVEGGEGAFRAWVEERLVRRYDPRLSRWHFSLPSVWQNRFERFASSIRGRALQVEAAASRRLERAEEMAEHFGIESLRGYALLFDAGERAEEADSGGGGERDRMLTLAESILRRSGVQANHWEQRLRALVEGSGEVEGRHYEESEYLGRGAATKLWREAGTDEGYLYLVSEGDSAESIAEEFYGKRSDYRRILKNNPQIRRGMALREGSWIVLEDPKSGERDGSEEGESVRIEGGRIRYLDREIDGAELPEGYIDILAESLKKTDANEVLTCRYVALPAGGALVVKGRLLCEFREEIDEAREASLLRIAAQIRGDLCLSGNLFLPLGYRKAEPGRRRFAEARLSCEKSGKFTIVLDENEARARLFDVYGQLILDFDAGDFRAMQMSPGRRLTDLAALPMQRISLLCQLWVNDLLRSGAEIVLGPVSAYRDYFYEDIGEYERFFVPIGTSVYPVACGKVVRCGFSPEDGHMILIEHAGLLYSKYKNLATLRVDAGSWVTADTLLGRIGRGEEICLDFAAEVREKRDNRWHYPKAEAIKSADIFSRLWHGSDKAEILTSRGDR